MSCSFQTLTKMFENLEGVSSRNDMNKILSRYLKRLLPEEIKISSYLVLGTIGPRYEKTDLAVGEKMAIRAICRAYDVSENDVEKLFRRFGDLGDVVSRLGVSARTVESLSTAQVYKALWKIKRAGGKGSHEEKIRYYPNYCRGLEHEMPST